MKTEQQSWWQLLAIQTGGTLCLPVIMIGQLIYQKYGWINTIISIALGNALLLLLGYFLANLSIRRPQSTSQHAVDYFGQKGRLLFSSIMILSMLGWFAIQLNVMSLNLSIPDVVCHIGMGMLITLTMCFGIKAIKNLSYITAPLLLFSLLYALFFLENRVEKIAVSSLSFGLALALVIGTNIAAIIDLPTFFRHAKSPRDGKICIALLYGLIVPLIELIGAYLYSYKGIDILALNGASIWIIILLLFSIWQTNNSNLYSAIVSSETLIKKIPRVERTLLLGFIGTAIACLNPLGHIEAFLEALSITIGSMGAIILRGSSSPKSSFLSWSIGVGIGMVSSYFAPLISGVPVVDAFFITFVIQTLLTRKKIYENVNNQ